jgi:hypothetical protein
MFFRAELEITSGIESSTQLLLVGTQLLGLDQVEVVVYSGLVVLITQFFLLDQLRPQLVLQSKASESEV